MDNMDKIEWFFFAGRPMPFILGSTLFPGYASAFIKQREVEGVGFEKIKVYNSSSKKLMEVNFIADEWNTSGNNLLQLIINRPKFVKSLLKTYIKEGKLFTEFAKRTSNNSFAFSDIQFLEKLKQIKTMGNKWGFWVVLPQTVDPLLEKYIREKLIRSRISDKSIEDDVLFTITKPSKDFFSDKEKIDFYKLCKNIVAKGINPKSELSEKLIKRHLNKYSWMKARWWLGNGETYSELLKRIEDFSISEDLIKERAVSKKIYLSKLRNYLKEINLSSKEKRLLDITRELVYLRTFRTDLITLVGFELRSFFELIAKKIKVTYSELVFLGIDELIGFFGGKLSDSDLRELIDKRKDSDWTCYFNSGNTEFNYTKSVSDSVTLTKLKGNPAFNGKVIGIVKLVFDKKDYSKMNEGDILVTTMTNPDFIPVMRIAGAIVTNEGGITCHAAILARELSKPCVIGTKVATKIFKDGDLVEVDANRGFVKKLG